MSADKRKLELLEISDMMKSVNGRNFIRRVLEHAGFFVDVFHDDPYKHANRSGARGEGVWLYNELLEACPGYLNMLIKEYNENAT